MEKIRVLLIEDNRQLRESISTILLHIATYTVKSHVHNILEKLELSTRLLSYS